MRNREQLVKLLTADDNTLDIRVKGNGVFVSTGKFPVISGGGMTVMEALLVVASRKKRFVMTAQEMCKYPETIKCIEDYECN